MVLMVEREQIVLKDMQTVLGFSIAAVSLDSTQSVYLGHCSRARKGGAQLGADGRTLSRSGVIGANLT